MAGSFLAGTGYALGAQKRLCLLDVTACLRKGTLAIHHAGVGFFPECLDECWIDISHDR